MFGTVFRLRNIQQAIKKLSQQSGFLRERILAGGTSNEAAHISRESNPTIRRLLSKGRPKPQERQETLTVLCQVEMLRFRVALLRQEKLHKQALVNSLEKQQQMTANENADRSECPKFLVSILLNCTSLYLTKSYFKF